MQTQRRGASIINTNNDIFFNGSLNIFSRIIVTHKSYYIITLNVNAISKVFQWPINKVSVQNCINAECGFSIRLDIRYIIVFTSSTSFRPELKIRGIIIIHNYTSLHSLVLLKIAK